MGSSVTSSSSIDSSSVGTETFQLLQGRRPQAQVRAISDVVMQFTPEPRAIEGEASPSV